MEEKNEKKENKPDKLLVYGIYSRLMASQKYYAAIQTRCRELASTWLLASFAGIGFLLSSKESGLPFHHLIGVAVISVIGILGVLLIWYEDLIVFEKLLSIAFLEAYKLERNNSWLPKLHHSMVDVYHHKNGAILKSRFYVGCSAILFLGGGISVGVFLNKIVWASLSIILSVVLIVLLKWLLSREIEIRSLVSKKKSETLVHKDG